MMRGSRLAGVVVVGLFCVLCALRVGWIARHLSALSPVGGGDPAPAFALPLLGGGEFALRTGEVTVLDFWATWCPPCRDELPQVDALHRRFKDRGVRVVAINTEGDEARAAVESLARSLGLTLPIALGGDEVGARYKVTNLPTLAVIAKNGAIARVLLGGHDEAELARIVERQLALP